MSRGQWLQTVSGRAFHIFDPRPEEIDIGDIAHALSMVCRFGGHVRSHYSVAEHSVRVSRAIREAGHGVEAQFHGLLHDASEAYLGDVVWPLKQAAGMAGYKKIEAQVEAAIFERFEVVRVDDVVKRFDLILLATEKRDLMNPWPGRDLGAADALPTAREKLGAWHCDVIEPLPKPLYTRGPMSANRDEFLAMFGELNLKRGK